MVSNASKVDRELHLSSLIEWLVQASFSFPTDPFLPKVWSVCRPWCIVRSTVHIIKYKIRVLYFSVVDYGTYFGVIMSITRKKSTRVYVSRELMITAILDGIHFL